MLKRLVLFLLITFLFVYGCGQNNGPLPEDTQKTDGSIQPQCHVLFGVDGGDWSFIVPLIKQGKLPVFEKIVSRGATGYCISQTMASPVEWTIIATGRPPSENGITGFVVHDPQKGKKTVVSGNLRKVKAFWNILSDYEKSVTVIGWWATWPAEKINGTMLSDLFAYRETIQNTAFPPEIEKKLADHGTLNQERIEKLLHQDFALTFDEGMEQKSTGTEPNLGLFRRDFKYDLEKADYFDFLLKEGQTEQIALFLNSTDIASHLFYRFTSSIRENGNWADDTRLLEHYDRMIEMAYRYAEKPITRIFENISELGSVMIVSDHGFTFVPYAQRMKWNILLEDAGLLFFHQSADKKNFRAIDWSRTLAYYDPRVPLEQGFVFAVQKNIDYGATGFDEITGPSEALEYTRRQIEAIKTQKGTPLFRILDKDTKNNYLILEMNIQDRNLQQGIDVSGHAYPLGRYFAPPHLNGGHRKEGIVLLWTAENRRPDQLTGATTYDILPTMMNLHSLPIAGNLRGHSLMMQHEAHLAEQPQPEYIDTYGLRDVETPESQISASVDATIKNKLKALGYID